MRIIREPLFHFLLLGAVIFAAHSASSHGTKRIRPGEIVVTQARLRTS